MLMGERGRVRVSGCSARHRPYMAMANWPSHLLPEPEPDEAGEAVVRFLAQNCPVSAARTGSEWQHWAKHNDHQLIGRETTNAPPPRTATTRTNTTTPERTSTNINCVSPHGTNPGRETARWRTLQEAIRSMLWSSVRNTTCAQIVKNATRK